MKNKQLRYLRTLKIEPFGAGFVVGGTVYVNKSGAVKYAVEDGAGGFIVGRYVNSGGSNDYDRFSFPGSHYKIYIHTLVAYVFGLFGESDGDGLVVNHKNGRCRDNRLCNLEVVTISDNLIHGIVTRRAENMGLRPRRLTAADAIAIRNSSKYKGDVCFGAMYSGHIS